MGDGRRSLPDPHRRSPCRRAARRWRRWRSFSDSSSARGRCSPGGGDTRARGRGTGRVVAVLPFENLGDSADAYFSDGVADEVRTKLTQVSGLW